MDGTTPRRRLTADDWTAAALEAIAEGGLDAAAVEPLAQRLGATKGSFYWHFANRRALLDRTLEAWEKTHTDAVITATSAAPEAPEQLTDLLQVVFGSIGEPLELKLLSAVDDPSVGAAVARVTERRVEYVAGLYRAAGHDEAAARSAAVTAVAVYLGHAQLAAAAPSTLPTGAAWKAHVARVGDLLAPRP
ncbi:TetR/AcrR family transcriptional regulator [Tsukamurella sputi]|uniref:TetR/AcrR family transcriptional regulator n=1 Tax=Tsukamurella sputi TaxID=2591848 RepID=A0A5C5RVC7_9ACTN|nr:TetR/AcrR family transcriptional regulator [Tsukamurella sputi]TWS26473.1 TetR/AcrR family transcriptional regulator [Tsukamurella sputi]